MHFKINVFFKKSAQIKNQNADIIIHNISAAYKRQ